MYRVNTAAPSQALRLYSSLISLEHSERASKWNVDAPPQAPQDTVDCITSLYSVNNSNIITVQKALDYQRVTSVGAIFHGTMLAVGLDDVEK